MADPPRVPVRMVWIQQLPPTGSSRTTSMPSPVSERRVRSSTRQRPGRLEYAAPLTDRHSRSSCRTAR